MTDNQLINLFAAQLDAAVASGGWSFQVVQKDQPTQQGVPATGAVFFQKLFDHPYGSPMISKVMDEPNMQFIETDAQWFETTFQISALVTQDPNNLTLPTASDVANYVKMYLASRAARNVMMAQNVGTLRVTAVRDPAFQDDRERFEYHPNFDIVFTHQRTLTIDIPGTNDVRPAVVAGISGAGVFPVPE